MRVKDRRTAYREDKSWKENVVVSGETLQERYGKRGIAGEASKRGKGGMTGEAKHQII